MWRAVLLLAAAVCCHGDQTVPMKILQIWDDNFEGEIDFPLKDDVLGWKIEVHFSVKAHDIQQYVGNWVQQGGDTGQDFILVDDVNKGYVKAGATVQLHMMGKFVKTANFTLAANGTFTDLTHVKQDPPTAITPPGQQKTDFNYNEVLAKSILFYDAQRSGKLPANNRIPWRGDSALNDSGDGGVDLSGGWYDAGDHVKFGFPMAFSTTLLAWSVLQYPDAYTMTGQYDYMLDNIKWSLDYFIKCHVAPNVFYVQVGDGNIDHGYWGRPEYMTMKRPAFQITTDKPGSDIAAETAAAMTAGYLVFKSHNMTYAMELLTHAKQLYAFADQYRALYSDSVPAAADFYKSSGYMDELGWGAAWLYRATNDEMYLAKAEKYRVNGTAWGDSWDDKTACTDVMLYNLTRKEKYKTDIEATFKSWMPNGTVPYTPGGLAFRLQWASNRYAMNMANMALMTAATGLNPAAYRCWARSQLHYVLGNNPGSRSFVVGFGNTPPQRPHHRASSCPGMPAPCSWPEQQQPGPDPQVLYGALVGGPDQNDGYKDDRNDYVKNEVACDYNAGFQSAVAAMVDLAIHQQIPPCS